jgi:dTDP-glucose 4,6-dehydratase
MTKSISNFLETGAYLGEKKIYININMCILITGGCGAIGSEVVNRLKLLHKDTHFVNLDLLTYAGKVEHIEPPFDNYTFVHGDICDISLVSEVLEKYKPQYIIHFAAETHVDNSFGNSLKFTTTNVYGTHVLLECVKQYIAHGNEFKMFLHMSTDEVYGSVSDSEGPKTEDALFAPSNPYAATKVGAEMICASYEKSFGLPIVIVRCNNAVSKYQHHEKLIPKAISCVLEGKRIPIHGEGKSKRTFIHAYDIADAMDLVLHCGKLGKVYNIGTEMEYTVIEVVSAVLAELGVNGELEDYIEFVPDRAFQDYRYYIDTTELRKLGWKERVTFTDAIRDVVKRYRKILTN